jgi:hypothetical protein
MSFLNPSIIIASIVTSQHAAEIKHVTNIATIMPVFKPPTSKYKS